MNMIKTMIDHVPPFGVFVCALLTVIIPYTINKINRAIHRYGDPPWKQNE